MNINSENNHKRKRPIWTRWLDIFLRAAHVAVTSVLFGGAVYDASMIQVLSWHNLTIATGAALVVSEIYHCRHWIYQIRGIMVLIHVGLLALIHLRFDLIVPVLTAVLVVGMFGSHMPKAVRYWSVVHRRVID